MSFGDNPGEILASHGVHITAPKLRDRPTRRAVTDLITQNICARHAHFFSEGSYPSHTPPAVMGLLLHRTIKHLHGRYLAAVHQGLNNWISNEQIVLEEYQIAEEAARMQGLPRLTREQSNRLQRMLCTFHTIEAAWFYPCIQAAEVNVQWLWEQAPGKPTLLEGKVDVVLLRTEKEAPSITLWDYKTGKHPLPGSAELRAYQQQMKLYAFLYRQCFKQAPQETALYFMQELAGKTPLTTRPAHALYHVPMTSDDDDDVLEWLYDVLSQEHANEVQGTWNPPGPGEIPQRLCQSCGIRWSCPSFEAPFPWEQAYPLDESLEPFEI